MHQTKTLEGEPAAFYVEDEVLTTLGLSELPAGIVGVDINNGLVRVIRKGNKIVSMKLGRALRSVGYSEEDCRKYSEIYRTNYLRVQVKFATTEDEILHVYENGPNSCMSNCDAVRVYAHTDTAVAYIQDEDRILARAVVCTNEEIGLQYARIYGFKQLLEDKLNVLGYKKGTLEGCKLKRITDSDGILICPFLDGASGIDDLGDELEIVRYGEFTADSTDGLLGCRCDHCDSIERRDDMIYSEWLDQTLCESCYSECHVTVDFHSYHIEDDDIIQLENDDYVLREEARYVEYRQEYHHEDDCYYNSYTEEYVLKEDIK